MKEIGIPEDIYSSEIKKFLFKNLKENKPSALNNLFGLLNRELSDNSLKKLKLEKEEISSLENLLAQVNNKEIIAVWNDYKFLCTNEKNISDIQLAVELYIDVYRKTEEVEYLNRALKIIKKTKSIFKNRIKHISEYSIEEIKNAKSSHSKVILTKNSIFLDPNLFLEELKEHFRSLCNESFDSKSFSNAKNYIEALLIIRYFTKEEYKIQLALCLEAKADHFNTEKEENTYYPNILQTYTDSMKELKGIKVSSKIRKRLEGKIKNEQRLYYKALEKVGIRTKNNLKRGIVKDLGVEGFNSGYNFLLSLPIIQNRTPKSKEKFLSRFFKEYVHISNKGTVMGITDEETYNSHFQQNEIRNNLISIIREVKFIMDLEKIISKELIYSLIEKSKSKFIPPHRIYLFAEGLYQGFKNNFIVSSHILLPQIENSLKQIIEQNGRNTTRLADEIQYDNTLGSILKIDKTEKEKMLNGICEEDLLIELNNFLIDGNSINFRNQVSHGLMDPLSIDYYGIYLWWLTLKLVTQTEKYFKF